MIVPVWASVAALYCLQNSMIGTPWGPSAVPTGGAGVALPAGIWIFTTAATRLLAMGTSQSGAAGAAGSSGLGAFGRAQRERLTIVPGQRRFPPAGPAPPPPRFGALAKFLSPRGPPPQKVDRG